MACACKVNQKIDYLHKKYGDNTPQSKKTNIRGSVLAKIENAAIYLLMIPLLPLMAIYLIYKRVKKENIHIDNFVKLNTDVGKQ